MPTRSIKLNCESCTRQCPQAELAHQIALGRKYATDELVSILKRIEKGDLVEVVRCRDCIFSKRIAPHERKEGEGDDVDLFHCNNVTREGCLQLLSGGDYCSYGSKPL